MLTKSSTCLRVYRLFSYLNFDDCFVMVCTLTKEVEASNFMTCVETVKSDISHGRNI